MNEQQMRAAAALILLLSSADTYKPLTWQARGLSPNPLASSQPSYNAHMLLLLLLLLCVHRLLSRALR
jgi:hypothetical protein